MTTTIGFTLLSIDAWRYDGQWDWNAWYRLEEDIYLEVTPRKILRFLRKAGYLTGHSKGRLHVNMSNEDCIVIEDKNTHEPFLALSTIHEFQTKMKQQITDSGIIFNLMFVADKYDSGEWSSGEVYSFLNGLTFACIDHQNTRARRIYEKVSDLFYEYLNEQRIKPGE